MESLFRFALHRPAVEQNKKMVIDLTQNSNYQAEIAASIGKENPRGLIKTASENFVKTSAFVPEISLLPNADKLKIFQASLDKLMLQPSISETNLKNAVKDAFGISLPAILTNQNYLDSLKNLKDTVIVLKHLPEYHEKPIEALTNAIRDLDLIGRISSDLKLPCTGEMLKKFRNRVLRLPTQADLKSILRQRAEDKKQQEEEARRRQEEKRKKISDKSSLYRRLANAVKEIMAIDSRSLETTTQVPLEGHMPPKEAQQLNIFLNNLDIRNKLGQLQILNAKTQIEKTNAGGGSEIGTSSISEKIQGIQGTQGLQALKGVGEFKPIVNMSSLFRFKVGTEKSLSEETQQILRERRLSIVEERIDKVVALLKQEMQELSDELELLTKTQKSRTFKRIGNALLIMNKPQQSMWGHLSSMDEFEVANNFKLDDRIPQTKGTIKSSGVADLLIVKQQLKRYEGKDVAHIENVLKGELKARTHRSFDQTIQDNTEEIETTKTKERELETTDRFELSQETEKTIKTDASLKAGLSVSGSYGPTVSFSASAEGSLSTSKSEAIKTASTFSKDVTQRSTDKLTERVKKTNRVIITSEVEETNTHNLNNTGGSTNISGVYQWVDKVYEAQMFNYGMRMMFDFMIPEPGAYLVESMDKSHKKATEITKPVSFTDAPNKITESNYNYWIHEYGAVGITPPPEEFITKSFNYNAGEGDEKTDYTQSGIIQIDEGYQAIFAAVSALWNQWSDKATTDVVVGSCVHRFTSTNDWVWTTSLSNETESIPFGLETQDVSDIVVAVEIKCQRTSRAYKKWQLETHSKLLEAYQRKMADYEEKLAALEVKAGIEIQGKNPALNLEIMNDEMKKNCITILTEQHFDLFDSIMNGTNGMPQIDLYQNKAEGPYVRFFEQAFEWEHMTWLTYPYFWGRKSTWEDKIDYDDSDPLFNQFIKAGYCRAVVPVRLGFEGAVDHYLTFGELWNGGPLPTISSDLYLPIAQELAERLERPGDEIPQGDPWEVRVPTNLVKLRQDDKLPIWFKDADGTWREQ